MSDAGRLAHLRTISFARIPTSRRLLRCTSTATNAHAIELVPWHTYLERLGRFPSAREGTRHVFL